MRLARIWTRARIATAGERLARRLGLSEYERVNNEVFLELARSSCYPDGELVDPVAVVAEHPVMIVALPHPSTRRCPFPRGGFYQSRTWRLTLYQLTYFQPRYE